MNDNLPEHLRGAFVIEPGKDPSSAHTPTPSDNPNPTRVALGQVLQRLKSVEARMDALEQPSLSGKWRSVIDGVCADGHRRNLSPECEQCWMDACNEIFRRLEDLDPAQ